MKTTKVAYTILHSDQKYWINSAEITGGSYGVGFETREASTRFKDALIALIATEQVSLLAQYDQPHEGEAQTEPVPAAESQPDLTK